MYKMIIFAAIICLSAITSYGQRMPQDSWVFSHEWGTNGISEGQFNNPHSIAVATNGQVLILESDNCRIQVFEADGTFVRKWGSGGSSDGQFTAPVGIAAAPNGLIFVTDTGNHRIQVFESDGTFVRKWGSGGSSDGQFSTPVGIVAAPNGLIFVTDTGNHRIQVFESDGTFVRKWGSGGSLDGQFNNPRGIAMALGGRVFVADSLNHRIQVFESDGTFVRKWGSNGSLVGQFNTPMGIAMPADGRVFIGDAWNHRVQVFEADGTYLHMWGGFFLPLGIAITPAEQVFVSAGDNKIRTYNPAYRIARQLEAIPFPGVVRCVQRSGAPYLDIDYTIIDVDSPTVTVAVAAFDGGTNSLKNFLKISTFLEGTQTNLGANVPANVTNRISWNVAADWQADYVNLKVRVMAQDNRGLLSIGYITLPADATHTALTISQSPINEADMLPLWFWFLATGDSSVMLNDGKVYGVGGTYNGVLLAEDTSTTASGRAFLFERIGVREATSEEVDRAKTGSSGVVNQWTPRYTIGPKDRPVKVNEYGFDTGGNGWWVVKD